jgi:hypothetical protein
MESLRNLIDIIESVEDSEDEYLTPPETGDDFAIEFGNDCLIESHVVDVMDDGIVITGDAQAIQMLESQGCKMETIRRYGAVGSSPGMGYTLEEEPEPHDDVVDRIMELAGIVHPVDEDEGAGQLVAKTLALEPTGPTSGEIDEAEYQGREVTLNKPMSGDVKKSKVYVKNANGNVVKVNFGDPNMRIKKSSPERRRSFRARHNCENPGPKTSARYWSCRAW